MNRLDDLLFAQRSLGDVLRAQLAGVRGQVDAVSKDQFLANSDEQVTEHIFAKMENTPLKISREQITRSEVQETIFTRQGRLDQPLRIPGVELELEIPYTGKSNLWKFQPSRFNLNPPCGKVEPNRRNDQEGVLKIHLQYVQQEFESNKVNQEIEKTLSSIEEFLGWVNSDIEAHNQQLLSEIRGQVSQRRERLGAMQETAKTINIPIKKREGAPDFTPLPIHRRQIKPLQSNKEQESSYGIVEEEYQAILNLIKHQGSTYEQTPETYSMHGEEGLRDILLGQLNGHFEGQATGETFRKKGKTDIRIEFENRAAFVAECKLWKGEKKILEAIDQMLGYLTWRDVKTSLVIFNKDVAGFKGIQEKLPEILKSHPKLISVEPVNGGDQWRMRLRSMDDDERFVEVHVFLFNLHVKPAKLEYDGLERS